MPPKVVAPSSPTFESAIQRLETVVDEMGSDQLPLEDLIKHYEEGIQLVKVCQEKLQAVEKRVELLLQKSDGDLALSTFDPEKKPVTGPREDVSLF
ncbi:MAG: exodeoxyribonuclease VII small subunit [Verrucomicrobiota bacterium]